MRHLDVREQNQQNQLKTEFNLKNQRWTVLQIRDKSPDKIAHTMKATKTTLENDWEVSRICNHHWTEQKFSYLRE